MAINLINLTDEKREALREWLGNLSDDEILSIVREINGYNGRLEELVWYDMEYEFDELMNGLSPWDIARMIYYGEFNPTNNYWRYDGYGNLESTDYIDYGEYDIDDIIDAIENIETDYIPNEIIDFLNEQEEEGDKN